MESVWQPYGLRFLNLFAFGEDIIRNEECHSTADNNISVAAPMATVQMIERQGTNPKA